MLRDEIYNELTRVLTEYEEGLADERDLYSILVKIQNNWEYLFTE